MPVKWHKGPHVEVTPELEKAFLARLSRSTDEDGSEHALWTGRMDHQRVPMLHHDGLTYMAAKVAWNIAVGEPVGRLQRRWSVCPHQACVNPEHYEDQMGRDQRKAREARVRREAACGHHEELETLRQSSVELQERVEELEERLAAYDVRLTGTLIKPNPGVDEFVLWSERTDTPKAIFRSRRECREYGLPTRKIRRAYATGSSDVSGCWAYSDPDMTFLFDQRGTVHRAHLVRFTELFLAEDEECWKFLQPLELTE